jgi:hypothetical protein
MFESAYAQAVNLIGAARPRTALFAAYLDETRTEVRIVHAFPDAAAMALHFEGSEERTQSVSQLIVPAGFEVYGQAPPAAIDQLRREAHVAGIGFDVLGQPIAGFLRAPA